MSGGGQMATATQAPAFSSGQTYGGMPIGNAYAQPPQQPQQQMMQQMGQQGGFMPFRNQSMDEGMVGPGYGQDQTPLGIAGLQNNLPPALGMPAGNMGGFGGHGGGTDVIVHGMPVDERQNMQQGLGGLQQMPSQQIMQMQNMIRPNMDSATY